MAWIDLAAERSWVCPPEAGCILRKRCRCVTDCNGMRTSGFRHARYLVALYCVPLSTITQLLSSLHSISALRCVWRLYIYANIVCCAERAAGGDAAAGPGRWFAWVRGTSASKGRQPRRTLERMCQTRADCDSFLHSARGPACPGAGCDFEKVVCHWNKCMGRRACLTAAWQARWSRRTEPGPGGCCMCYPVRPAWGAPKLCG